MVAVGERLAALPADPRPGEDAVATRRRIFRERSRAAAGVPVPMAAVADLELPGAVGPVRVRRYDPSGTGGLPVIVYAHGGGWVVGDRDTHDGLCRILARASGCLVVSVDYRLAPEHPGRAGVEDVDGVVAHLTAAALPGWDGRRIALAGDSAGGWIAAVVAARRRSDPRIRAQLLLYPVTDLRDDTPGYGQPELGWTLTAEEMRWYLDVAWPDRAERADPAWSPLRAADVTGLPPACIAIAEIDPLAPEGRAYARRLLEAGHVVEVLEGTGLGHGFGRLAGSVPAGAAIIERCGAWLQRTLAAEAPARP